MDAVSLLPAGNVSPVKLHASVSLIHLPRAGLGSLSGAGEAPGTHPELRERAFPSSPGQGRALYVCLGFNWGAELFPCLGFASGHLNFK